MVTLAKFDEDFYEIFKNEKKKVVLYGAGNECRKHLQEFPVIDMICDQNAAQIQNVDGIPVCLPEEMCDYEEPFYIIICVRNRVICDEIVETISKLKIDAKIFLLFNNISFTNSYHSTMRSYVHHESDVKLKVNIVNRDQGWIFNKFTVRMQEMLLDLGVNVTISADTRSDVDINHHIPMTEYKPYPNDTLMITHVHNTKILSLLKKQLKIAGIGICMSKATMNQLVEYGVPRDKLCYINPAQDNVIKSRKYTMGITNRCYDGVDLRKRADSLLDALEGVDASYFRFVIMGSGWDNIVEQMRRNGFEVEYYPEFLYDTYTLLMQQIDYFLYMGFDEGAMGYLDALKAGAGTIVTPQGYHLDVDCPIDYPCSTVKQFREAFLDLQEKRKRKADAVKEWNWKNYAVKHLEIWEYLLARKPLKELYKNQLLYEDGIFSMLPEDHRL